ncbi:MAG TPA: oxidoreductase [Pyrinomonadaceae bacterium]|nr:oxidoreductase [Pyrinomonadaceae bacterium]
MTTEADVIGVGLVGYGMASRVFHAPVIGAVPFLSLKKIVERRGEESRGRHAGAETVREFDEVLRDDGIELVVVATPNDSHFDLASRALSAGKHVVVEKPFTNTSAEARELTRLARGQNRLVSAHHNRRWDGDFLTVRKILEGGLLGRLVEYESHFDRYRNEPRPGAWRERQGPGSGVLYDLGSHLIDQALVLFGLPNEITADVRTRREFAKADDSFDVRLGYEGLSVTLKATMLAREPGPRFTLHGTEGSFVKHGLDPQEDALKLGGTPLSEGWGREPVEHWGVINTGAGGVHVRERVETIAGDYAAYYRNVADAIRGRAESVVKPEEAANTIRVIELALESSAAKRTLPFSP